MKKILSILVIVALIFSLTSCKKKKVEEAKVPKDDNTSSNVVITLSEYEKIKVGMTYEEVTKIVGGNCNKLENNAYLCSGEYAGTNATLTFDENNKLKEKKQIGL